MYIMKHIKNVCRKNELFKTWFIGWLLLKTWIPWNFKILQVIQRNLIKIRNKLCNRQLKNIFLLYLKLLEAKLYLDHLVVHVLLGLVANHLKCNHLDPRVLLYFSQMHDCPSIYSVSAKWLEHWHGGPLGSSPNWDLIFHHLLHTVNCGLSRYLRFQA